MSGIWKTNVRRLLGLAFACGTAGLLRADELTLAGHARLTGQVRSFDDTGVVVLASVLSPELVALKAGTVKKVDFSVPVLEPKGPQTSVELINGDHLAVMVESLDAENLRVQTAAAGPLTIPRKSLKSMQFGIQQSKTIYRGPQDLAEWNRSGDSAKNWTFANGALVARGTAEASKNFKTPLQFVFRFTLKWQSPPDFQIFFADPLTPDATRLDRYQMQFNGAGLEIKRQTSEGKKLQSVILINRTPDQFPGKQLQVELRVDRMISCLHLILDGEPAGAGVDPVAEPPAGNGIRFVCDSTTGAPQEIRDIEITEFSRVGGRNRPEDRGDAKTDSLVSWDEDRWSGRLLTIEKQADGRLFSFKSDFQEAPLEIVENDVAKVYFADPEDASGSEVHHPFALQLAGGGLLKVSSCVFSEESVVAQHPLLGLLTIQRYGIMALERQEPKAKSKRPPATPVEK